mmetsp:Transcript_17399/g.26583  ORF Transcript_17399/g.26583 Transcript_17399/m.26583 type:complete len:89 (+) Transcript_17399:986-1252(+)
MLDHECEHYRNSARHGNQNSIVVVFESQNRKLGSVDSGFWNDDNIVSIATAGGISTVCKAIRQHPHDFNVQDYGRKALSLLTRNSNNN